MKESDLAEHIILWLEDQHWDVYQEVRIHGAYGPVADIVAVRAGIVWIIECKTSLSLSVLAQANRHFMCHKKSIAIPAAKMTQSREFAYRVAEQHGIGVLTARGGYVDEPVPAKLHRRNHGFVTELTNRLSEDHKTHRKAGAQDGQLWTPYRRTMEAVKRIIADNPGGTINKIMNELKEHHYAHDSSARSGIRTGLAEFESSWCRIENNGRLTRYFIREKQ